MKNWPEISFNSHYLTAIEVKKSLVAGEVMDAEAGLDELIDAMARADRRAVKSQLIRLMKHIIKWQMQPDKRSWSWVKTIVNARIEIRDIQEETPSITQETVFSLWERAFSVAVIEAEEEMNGMICTVKALSWEEVFNADYWLDV